jgi:hypothetical protein
MAETCGELKLCVVKLLGNIFVYIRQLHGRCTKLKAVIFFAVWAAAPFVDHSDFVYSVSAEQRFDSQIWIFFRSNNVFK